MRIVIVSVLSVLFFGTALAESTWVRNSVRFDGSGMSCVASNEFFRIYYNDRIRQAGSPPAIRLEMARIAGALPWDMRSFKPVIGNLPWLIDHENDPRVNIIRADTSPHPITGKTTRRFEYVFDLFYEPAPLNGVAQEPIEERVTMVLSETHGTSNHAFAP